MYIKRNRTSKILTTLLSLLLIVSVVFPMELAHVISKNLFARAAMTVGGSGSLVPGSPQTAVSGIAPGVTFRNPPLRVSLFRDKKALLTEEEGLSKIYHNMKLGFPQNITASVHFIRPETATFIGSKPISIGEANTANKTLTYLADSNAISNIITMEGGTPNTTNGVYYSAIKATGLDNFKTNWRSKMTSTYASKEAWSWILAKSGDDYLVDTRIKTLFGGENGDLDYNNIKAWTDAQSNDAYMRYLDMLMTLYTLSSGDTKEQWGQAVDDYINSDNLQESPISISIDSEALMSFNGGAYFILIPTIDYLEFATGLEKAFATSEDIWWATSALTDAHPGHSYAQLELSAKKSVAISPTFARISDYYTNQNGFSFAATAFTKGVLRTQSPTSIFWTAPDSILTDYLNIFRLEDPANPGGGMYGYMLSPAPLKVPSLSVGVLKAEPDNKVIETKAIGMPVSLTVTSGTKAEDYGSWEAMILNARTQGNPFNIKMAFSRTSTEVPQIPFISPNPAEFNWTPDEMLDFIYGRKNYIGTDDTSGISTEGKSQITFNYTLATTITSGGKTWTGTSTDTASFRILAPRIGYTSKPDAYSELKNYGTGSNLTGNLTENWEAMAGVPSTEQLYFAAGGSEFIVDITVERIEDEIAKRSYDSYYTTTNCEFFTGDTSKGLMGAPDHGGLASGSTVNQTGPSGGGGCGSPPGWTPPNPGTRTYTYTSASDVRARSVTVSPVFHDTSSTSVSHSEGHGSGSSTNPHSCGHGACSYSYAYSGYWTYTIPMHAVCGPCCSHVLPEVHDTWAQTWTYDAMKIVDVHVWKIDQAAVDGLTSIISTDIVGADIVKGEPNIFYNIALKNDANFMAQNGRGGATGSSMAGRVRYSIDAPQHDEVTYANGTRTNNCDGLANTYGTNTSANGGSAHTHAWADGFIYNAFKPGASTGGATAQEGQKNYPTDVDNFLVTNTDEKDKATTEYAKFLSQRQTKITPTMITDFLILQTSNGDQAVMYFHKPAPSAVNTETKMPQLNITTAEMWDNNLNSASKWQDDHINIGGYNGKYRTPASKFTWPNQGNAASTFLDPDPAGRIVRPTRPSSNMMLYKGALNIILQNKNKSYVSGKAEVFWANSLHWVDSSSERFLGVTDALTTASFPTNMQTGQTGFNFHTIANYTPSGPAIGGYILAAPYSDEHVKINDLIVQDPVSTQDVSLVSLPDDRDQRTGEILGGAEASMDGLNNSLVCPREPALCDFRVLNCTFFEDTVLADFDFSTVDLSGNPINKTTGNSLILPAGFTLQAHGSLTGAALRAQGTRVALPFSELQLQYSSSTNVRVEADVVMSAPTGNGSMLFSFGSYDLYIPVGQTYATLNTGNGWERKINKPIADGVKHKVVIEFSFNSVDSCRVLVDGVEGYTRIGASTSINSQMVGNNLYIGSWGISNSYPANFYMDNLKITRLAGTTAHNEDCYKLMTVHPNGLNAHQHAATCLDGGTSSTGADWLVDAITNGDLTEQQIKDILGDAYEPVMANSFGPVIHTWSNWTSGNMYGFNALNQVSLAASGGNLVQTSSGVDPYFDVPVNFAASGVTKIEVTLDNKTASTYSQLLWGRNDAPGYSGTRYVTGAMQPNVDNQVVTFVVRGNAEWKNTIESLRFDLGATAGIANVKSIRVYGGGTRTSAGSSNGTGTVVWQGGTAGAYTYSAPAGRYYVEVWGAQGGQNGNAGVGGNGGYATGSYTLNSSGTLSIVIGGVGSGSASSSYWTSQGTGGYNGGGAPGRDTDGNDNGRNEMGGGGGGYTTIKNGATALVTAGGGGGRTYTNSPGGRATGGAGGGSYSAPGSAGTLADSGGIAIGGVVATSSTTYEATGWINSTLVSSGIPIAANATMPNPSGGSMVGKTGDGYAKVTSMFSPVSISGGSSGSGVIAGQVLNYNYTGNVTSVVLPAGTYKFEVWGAQGGKGTYVAAGTGGTGGYAVGVKVLASEQTVNVYTGGQGRNAIEANSGSYVVDNPGGWNGGGYGGHMAGSGGGGTDIRLGGTATANRVIVAGGGGGGGQQSSGGPATKQGGRYDEYGNGGSGATATYTSTGTGGNAINTDNGGGGGGYLGGIGSQGPIGTDWGGDGGSNYAGGVVSANGITAQTIAGNATIPSTYGGTQIGNSGNGYARITALDIKPVILVAKEDIKNYWNLIPDTLPNGTQNPIWACSFVPNIHVCDSGCVEVDTLVCAEPHHKGMHYDPSNTICWDACMDDETHKNYKPTINASDGSFTPGNFINMDYGFRIYFPNVGDFADGQPYGIGGLTSQRGLGFKNSMDTTKWTREKRIKFEFNVIYQGTLYLAGEWILLGDRGSYGGSPGSQYNESQWSRYGTALYNDVSKQYYDFYSVLANYEAKSASIKVEAEAVNCPGPNDNKNSITNRSRGRFTALHGGSNTAYADIVGRIGNLIIEDTGDYRFSNFFKKPLENNTVPIVSVYGTANGLVATGSASINGTKIDINELGNSATVKDLAITRGFYRVDITGKALNNGRLKVQTKDGADWSGADYIGNVTVTTTKMSFHLTVPDDKEVTISWVANNSTAMEVQGIALARLGDSAENWIIDGVVREVDESDQNFYMTWSKDIRGLPIGNSTNQVNTYNTLNWVDGNRIQAPISAEKNNISILKDEPLLVGYPIYFDISTLGNYFWNNSSSVQVVPYYYALNTTTKQLVPVDAYFQYEAKYEPVNIHNLVNPAWAGEGIYNYVITLDWLGEHVRRNYTDIEKKATDFFRDFYAEGTTSMGAGSGESGDAGMVQNRPAKQLDAPVGSSYILGNAQFLRATGKARTFIGGETTYGELMNRGGSNTITTDTMGSKYNAQGRLYDYLWWQSAQRWHLKLGLPSSSVFVRTGEVPDTENIKEFDNSNHVILLAADIRVIGDTYVLRYEHNTDNGSINIQRTDGTTSGPITLPNNIPPVLAVYSTVKSSMYDIDIISTH
ncbi:hypothetical protein JCM17380_13080 [Desulfosporosinus burensis]